ncbi:MAG: GCN5-related N-acetyltransferase [Phycisphaerales bacterium]|nr:GCN5-related N-acetyltransferase [Phycisphaerales bacterium]
MPGFLFREPGDLQDGEFQVVLTRRAEEDAGKGRAPSYWFTLRAQGKDVGMVNLRIGCGQELDIREGHISYTVYPPFQGRHYAERACRLLLPLAKAHGMQELWITCHPDNLASRRTCERLGAVLVEIVVRPKSETSDMAVEGDGERCRYRIDLRRGQKV